MSEHEKVKDFHRALELPTNERPTMPDEATRVLRCRLLLEETLEYIRASGCVVMHWGDGRQTVESRPDLVVEPNLAAMAQENADVRYIAHGNDLAMGVDGRVFDEVHRANLSKTGGSKRSDGKVLKPEGWKPPDVERVLAEWDIPAQEREP